MCGITGYLNLKKSVDWNTLYNMNQVISHRGPDDEGYAYFGTTSGSLKGKDTISDYHSLTDIKEMSPTDAFLVFGHRRLSIIDVSAAGHQPMFDREQKYCITFNGEIYNYIEIKQELIALGHHFTTNSDTEVILEAYKEWEEDCVQHFNGMWGFAIYDLEQKKLFCSRDRLGAKPFYYILDDQKFIFASEIKQICQDPDFDRYMNEQMVLSYILFRLTDFGKETFIKDIYALPGGYNLSLKIDLEQRKIVQVNLYQYWNLKIDKEKNTDIDKWYDLMKDSVKLRLRSDAPVGAMCSGGVDSSFLISEIKDCYEKQGKDITEFKTFTSCYHNAEIHDETYFAHLVNEACGVEEHLIYPDAQNTFQKFKNMVWHYEGYCTFSNLGSFLTLEEISKSGIKVLINGQGGDESMLGYERYYTYYFLQLLCKGKIKKLISEYKKAVKHSRLNMKEMMLYFVYFGFPCIRKYRNLKMASSFIKKELLKKFDYDKIRHILKVNNLDTLIYNELRETQLTHILRFDDRGYMAFSMESRVPFIDYRYLENVVNIDPMQKIENGYTKYLVRKRMESKLPDEVVWRTNKNGWSSPSERWISRFTDEDIQKIFDNPVSACYFDINEMKKIFKKNPVSREFESFLVIELFMQLFKVKPSIENN